MSLYLSTAATLKGYLRSETGYIKLDPDPEEEFYPREGMEALAEEVPIEEVLPKEEVGTFIEKNAGRHSQTNLHLL